MSIFQFGIDYLLDIEALNAIQINKDVGGPSVEEMLPIFQKVQKQKNLVLWGDFTEEEFAMLSHHLPPEGVYIMTFSENYIAPRGRKTLWANRSLKKELL